MPKVLPSHTILSKYRLLFIIVGALILVLLISLGLSLLSKPIANYDDCIAAGNKIQESNPAVCVTKSGKRFTQASHTERKSIEGTIVCLPHKNTDGPQTLECATGLKTKEGIHYSLKTNEPNHTLTSEVGSSKTVQVTGIVTNEPDSIYQTAGQLHVESYETQ